MKKRHILLFMLPLLLCCPQFAESAPQELFSSYQFDTFRVSVPNSYAGKGICSAGYDIGSASGAQRVRMDIYEAEWGTGDHDATFEEAKQKLLLVTHPDCDCAQPCDRTEDAQAAFNLPGVIAWSTKNNAIKHIQALLHLQNGYVVFEMSGERLPQNGIENDKAFFLDAVKEILAQSAGAPHSTESVAHTLFLRLDTSRGAVAGLSLRFENAGGSFTFSSEIPADPLQVISPQILPSNTTQAWVIDKPLSVAGQSGHYHIRYVSPVNPQTKMEAVTSTTVQWEGLDASKRKLGIVFSTNNPEALKQGYGKFLETEQVLRVLQSIATLP